MTEADAAVSGCRLVGRLRAVVPEIVTGPVHLDAQYWIATGKPPHRPPAEPQLNESHFTDATSAVGLPASTKPFGVGLFTSTGVLGGHGMWRTYLDIHWGSTLFPLPWYTWAVRPHRSAVVHEIASAAQWADLARSYPRMEGELIYPDWRRVARDYDAVHMTLHAISATQGLDLHTDDGIVAAPYWDVESTLWLRWCFASAELVDITSSCRTRSRRGPCATR